MEPQRRLPRRPEFDVVGRDDRQLLIGHRYRSVLGAVDDRNGAAPKSLTGQQPVPQAEVDLSLTEALLFQPVDRLRDRVGFVQAIQPLTVDGRAVAGVRIAVPVVGRLDRSHDRQPVRVGEVPVALILAGHGHDRAGAVRRQHVVGQVDRHQFVVERIDPVRAREHTALLEAALARQTLHLGFLANARDERRHFIAVFGCRDLLDQLVLRREHAERHAEARVRTRGVHPEAMARGSAIGVADLHLELGALGAADPVALHGDDALRPIQLVEVVEQLLRVLGDLEEPLLQVALLHDVARAFARAVGQHLFVGQHRLTSRAPVDRGLGPVDEARFQEPQKDPLRPADEVRIVTLHDATPVVHRADSLQRRRQLFDTGVGERTRMLPALDRGVLGRQPEAVEANRAQHAIPVHRPVADDQVAERVVADVAHVRRTRRIRVHRQHVERGPRVVVVDLVRGRVGASVAATCARLPVPRTRRPCDRRSYRRRCVRSPVVS